MIQQAAGNFEVKEAHLVVCKARLMKLLKNFKDVAFEHIPCSTNSIADALAVLGSRFTAKEEMIEPIIWFARHDAPVGAVLPSVL